MTPFTTSMFRNRPIEATTSDDTRKKNRNILFRNDSINVSTKTPDLSMSHLSLWRSRRAFFARRVRVELATNPEILTQPSPSGRGFNWLFTRLPFLKRRSPMFVSLHSPTRFPRPSVATHRSRHSRTSDLQPEHESDHQRLQR